MAQLRLVGGTLSLPTGIVTKDAISTTSGQELDVDTLEHLYKAGTNFGVDRDATPTAQTKLVFVASTAGVIRGFHCGLYDTGTTTDVNFDLKVNGSTVLSAVVNVTNADADRAIKDGTLASNPHTLAADDWVEIDLAITTSTGALGPWAWCDIQELAE